MNAGPKWPFAWAALALIAGSTFVVVNAPFQVPDEVGHYWRAAAMAEGTFAPAGGDRSPSAEVPRGVKDLVATTWVETAGKEDGTVGLGRLRDARKVELRRNERVRVKFPAFYTPLPYLPQAAVLWCGARLDARPFPTFYAARLANLATMLALLLAAMVIAPRAAWIVAAAGSLPMTLHLAGSLSPDAATLGMASVAFAAAVTERRLPPGRYVATVAAAAFVLALCKPVYFLIPLVAIWNRNVQAGKRAVFAAVVGAAIASGVMLSVLAAARGSYNMRGDAGVDPRLQASAVARTPLTFIEAAASDYHLNHARYRHEMVGRLGWLDVGLPRPLSTFAQLALLAAALTAARVVSAPQRGIAAGALAATLLLIALSQYVVWTPVGARAIEGVQGRYFIPVIGLFAVTVQVIDRRKVHAAALVLLFASLALLDVIGAYRVWTRYF